MTFKIRAERHALLPTPEIAYLPRGHSDTGRFTGHYLDLEELTLHGISQGRTRLRSNKTVDLGFQFPQPHTHTRTHTHTHTNTQLVRREPFVRFPSPTKG